MKEFWSGVLWTFGGTTALVLLVGGAIWNAIAHYCSKWLDNRFGERLKRLEQQHDVMVRHLQSTIDREFDRAVRLHTKEFRALSKGWAVLHEAYWRARVATGRSLEIVQFQRMSPAQAASFIERSELEDWQREELRAIGDPKQRDEYYEPAFQWLRYRKALDAKQSLVTFIDRNAIFLQPEVRALFDQLEVLIQNALIEFKIRIEQTRPPLDFTRSEELAAAQESTYKDLERQIHARLWSSTLKVEVDALAA